MPFGAPIRQQGFTVRPILTGTMVLAATAVAEARPDVRSLSCARVQAMIDRNGAIVMTTGRHTFERFVNSRRYCENDQRVQPVRIDAADGRCTVRGACRIDPFDDLPGFSD